MALNVVYANDVIAQNVSRKPQVINKGYFSEAFLFKPRGGRSPTERFKQKAEEISFILLVV